MNKRTIMAAIATPLACATAGVMIARYTNADATDVSGYCAEPTVYVDIAGGVSMVSGGMASNAACEGDTCTVTGLEQVEINGNGEVQCVNVNAGQMLSLTQRGDGLSVLVEETTAP